jgi:hypothetical protein
MIVPGRSISTSILYHLSKIMLNGRALVAQRIAINKRWSVGEYARDEEPESPTVVP